MKFKRGDSFKFTINMVEIVNGEEQPLEIEVENLKCQVKTISSDTIEELEIEKGTDEGEYIFKSKGTNGYPEEDLEMDIKIKKEDEITSSETIKITVEKAITLWEENNENNN